MGVSDPVSVGYTIYGYHEGDGSRAGILFYMRYEIQEEVATIDLV